MSQENKEVLKVNLYPELGYTHSTYAKAGNFIFTSYHGGVNDDNGNLLETIEAQTEQTFKNLQKTLKHAGVSLDDIVKITVLIKHKDEFRRMVGIYKQHFKDEFPVRTTIITDFLSKNILLQIDAVAYIH